MEYEGLIELIMIYVVEEALILLPLLMVVGFLLKNTLYVYDKYIPLILVGLGILLAVLLLGFSLETIIQGVFVAGLAVLSNQIYKQSKKEY